MTNYDEATYDDASYPEPSDTENGAGTESSSLTVRAALLDYLENQYVVPDVKNWELQNERAKHEQSLYRYGEYAIFVLMWNIDDFQAGLVQRCPTCFTSVNSLISDTFKQPEFYKCPTCYGTTFNGGYKAMLVRPSIWQWAEPQLQQEKRGYVDMDNATIQTTSDFRMQPKDYVIRGDGTRWQVKGVDALHLATGFGTQAGPWNSVSYTYSNVTREDESSVVYQIPVSEAQIQAGIPQFYSRKPIDFNVPE